MTYLECKQMLREAVPSHYQIKAIARDSYVTLYAISHKRRVVGAVCYDGDCLPASSIREAQDWWAGDN